MGEVETGYERAWRQLAGGAAKRRHGFRTFTLATVGADDLPQARTMVLREADETRRVVRFHLDARSPKFAELCDRPPVCLVFYGDAERLQVRIFGTAILHHSDDVCRAVWNEMPAMSQEAYRTPHAPTTKRDATDHAEPLSLPAAFENFAVCYVAVQTLEWLSLSSEGHERARHVFGDGESHTQALHP